MSPVEIGMWLLFTHFIADWGTGNSWIGANKGKWPIVMIAHCMMYTGVCILALKLLGFQSIISWAVWIFMSHIMIDWWKSMCADPKDFPTWHLYIDQAAHIGILWGPIYFGKM